MAGGKETPRQKMVGMMYLVLTAMLALNVSKDIINAFVTQDNQMLVNNNNLVEGINGFLTKFNNMAIDANSKKSYAKWKPKIDKVVKISNEIDLFLIENLNELMFESEEVEDWFTKNNDSQFTQWKNLEEIKNKENFDIATRLFGGEKFSEGYKKGANIRVKLLELRSNLIFEMANYQERGKTYSISKEATKNEENLIKELTESKHPDKLKLISIYKMLSQPEKLLNHDKEETWQYVKFDHQPIVGAIGVFTEFRNQVRMAEQKALELIYGKIDQPIMRINKIEPQVIANSRYMNIGDTIGVRVGIIAYDSTATYPIKYNLGSQEITSKNSRFTLKGSSVGTQSINGSLTLDLADGKKEFPWSFDYVVGKPTGAISSPEYSIFYGKYKNLIKASVSGSSSTDVRVSCPACKSVVKKGENYEIEARTGSEVEVIVSSNSTTIKRKYKVLPLPDPIISFVNRTYGNVNLVQCKNGNVVVAKNPPSSPLKVNYEVASFELDLITRNKGILPGGKSNNKYLTGKMKNVLRSMSKNDKVEISNVKYRIAGNSSVKPIKGVILKAI